MDWILGSIDPSALLGLIIASLLLVGAGLLYGMRDPVPLPRYSARRVRCPHKGRKFTVELNDRGAVHYCPAFLYGELPCDTACTKAGSDRRPRRPLRLLRSA